MTTPRNPQQNFDNATMLDAVLLEISIKLKANLSWLNNCYTAAQKLVKTEDNREIYYPGVYIGNNNYLNLLPDGHLGNYSFFKMNDPEEIDFYPRNINDLTANFDLIIWFNLKKVYPNDTGRNVEHVKKEVLAVFREMTLNRGRIELNEIYKEAKNIYNGYTIKETDQQFMMHPYGALMIRGTLKYKEEC